MLPLLPLILLSTQPIVFFVFWSKAAKWLIVSFVKQSSKEKFFIAAVKSVINTANCLLVFCFGAKPAKWLVVSFP